VVLFHGEAILPAGRYGSASHTLDESDMRPMRLIANGFKPPDVFCPERSCNLVISERVKNRLEPNRVNFQFLPVALEKVIYLPWMLGGQPELPEPHDTFHREGREFSILKSCPHDPQAAVTLPAYYELVTPNHYHLLKAFPPTHRFFTKWYQEPCESDLLPVSRAMFEVYPITDPGYTVMRNDLFDTLSPFMEMSLFGIKEFAFE
jgi:hypothetical protein